VRRDDAGARRRKEDLMTVGTHSMLAAGAVAAMMGTLLCGSARGAEPSTTGQKVSKSGMPYLSDDQLGPPDLVSAIRARRGGKLLNLDRMLLHSPNFAKGWNAMFGAIRNQLSVPAKLRELAIMQIGVLNKAEYEWAQHEGEFLKAGGTREQLQALRNGAATGAADPKLFNEAEQMTLQLTREMTQQIKVSDATMKRARSMLPDAQVVELIGTISGYNMVSRFAVATGLDIEESIPTEVGARK
jgi:alkylhydroperoxidase family enzyme